MFNTFQRKNYKCCKQSRYFSLSLELTTLFVTQTYSYSLREKMVSSFSKILSIPFPHPRPHKPVKPKARLADFMHTTVLVSQAIYKTREIASWQCTIQNWKRWREFYQIVVELGVQFPPHKIPDNYNTLPSVLLAKIKKPYLLDREPSKITTRNNVSSF